jgi:hypothetical protein
MRNVIAITLLLSCLPAPFAHAAPTLAHATTAKRENSLAFMGLLAGESLRGQAESQWQAKQVKVSGQFHGNALESFPFQGEDSIANLRVVVAQVENLPVAELESARFAFFDEVLYKVNARYRRGISYQQALAALVAQYGQPAYTSDKGQARANWQDGNTWLMLSEQSDGQVGLLLEDMQLTRKVRTSNIETYAAYIHARQRVVALP